MHRTLLGKVTLVGFICLLSTMIVGLFASHNIFAIQEAANHLTNHTVKHIELTNTVNTSLVNAIAEAVSFTDTHNPEDRDQARQFLEQADTALAAVNKLEKLSKPYRTDLKDVRHQIDVLLQAVDAHDEQAIKDALDNLNQLEPAVAQARARDAAVVGQETTEAIDAIDRLSNQAVYLYAGVYGLFALVLLLLLLFLHQQIIRPIKTLSRVARRAANGDLDQVVHVTNRDELGDLQRAFARMVGNLGETLVALQRQIKEQAQTEEALRISAAALYESEQQYRSVAENISEVIFRQDTSGVWTFLNPAWTDITGFTVEESLGRPFWEFIHPEDRQSRFEGFQRGGHQEKEFFQGEVRHITKDGGVRWLDVRHRLIYSDGVVTGIFGTLNDVTERKQMESLKHEFVSTVSHELRTPLTSIHGSLGLIAGGVAGVIPPQARTMIEIAYKNSERLVRLINDILDIERIEAGKMVFNFQPLDLVPLVERAITDNRGYGDQFGVTFALDANVSDVQVNVDSDRMIQVITNLLSNATKFAPTNSTVTVTVARVATGVRIAVTDRGPGIPEAFRERIFQKFAQSDASDTRQKEGTGLGLSISKAIVERCGGQIGFTTATGLGTTFFVDLPEWRSSIIPVATTVSPASQRQILICEDDRDIATLLTLMLAQSGCRTDVAYTAAQARALLAQTHYDAMTLDLGLPDQDGVSLIRELKHQPQTCQVPIVVVSARADHGRELLNGDALLVADWLDKPIDQRRLVAAVQRAIQADAQTTPRILHVEDDADLRQVIALVLRDVATIVPATSLHAATTYLRQEPFDLVILDLSLPDGSGLELIPLLRRQQPALPVVVFSAHELDPATAREVAAVLVKSRTSNHTFLETIMTLIRYGGQLVHSREHKLKEAGVVV